MTSPFILGPRKKQRTLSGVSTKKQSSGLVSHENSTFRNLALAISGPFMAYIGALYDFNCACDSTLVYVCQADAEKCIFVWTILSQTPRHTPRVMYDVRFQPEFLDCPSKNGKC